MKRGVTAGAAFFSMVALLVVVVCCFFVLVCAVVWNGLVSIVESRSRDVQSDYLDGIKYQERAIPGYYAARLTAFTYPDALDSLVGNAKFAPGVTVYDQPSRMFHLSYRTLLGDD